MFSRRGFAFGAAGGVGAFAIAGASPAVAAPAVGEAATGDGVYTINVRDHGAKGDNKTDDSDAIRAAVAAAVSSRSGVHAQREIYFPPGQYLVTKKDTLMWSPTAGKSDQIFGLRFRGGGPRVTNINFASSFAANADPRENNLITAAMRLRYVYFNDMSFSSTNPNNRFAYYYSRDGDDTAYKYPEYGYGQNQYFVYQNVEWRGQWDRVIGIDGDQQANNNSEHHFMLCSTDTASEYTDSFLRCGGISGTNDQQNQFLNFFVLSCNFALRKGNFFRFDRGGSINVYGGSWSMVGNSDGTQNTCKYFYMPLANGNTTAARLNVNGVRFEPRATDKHRIIDCNWNNGSVTFTSCSDVGAVQGGNGKPYSFHEYKATSNRLPIVRYQDCVLAGRHLVSANGTSLTNGKMIYEGCRTYHNTKAVGGTSDADAFLQYAGTPARYAFRDSWATPDVSG
ncbi:hypothetical protein GCM10027280_57200 [Micromonospora polyrhachis]|uniref:Tfp pilus assembly protein FimT n=1 Tax=Micromonospora polyrhachis TaxID=1282883 RepID=A0A7W7WRF2_9ACTN|nr:glycosyl hydrolase family 28-related protein [Micromonospora polyrhachis]MBB4960243.1 Tfp pilus assembly protein FimT [Micromonospora polyrhachis]